MNPRSLIFLFLLALIPSILIAQFQPSPGYLDADYYYAGGIQLVNGNGFTEPYLWNYLDGTTSLPHPSHSYWQPLASIVAAFGMWLTGQTAYASARIFFIIIAALVAPVTASLAFSFSQRRDLAFTSGLLAIFSVFPAYFLSSTDNFGIFMLVGGLFFLVSSKLVENPPKIPNWFFLGLISGFSALARTDGLLWLGASFLFVLFRSSDSSVQSRLRFISTNSLIILFGFLLVMSPWYARNYSLYGWFMAPGSSLALWLTEYDQIFTYPPSELTAQSFFAHGWQNILTDRLRSIGINLQNAFAAHGAIVLFPFTLIGFYAHRKDERIKVAGIAWLILFLIMSVVYPFAGARGGFFHAGAAFIPLWFALAPLGLERFLSTRKRMHFASAESQIIFRSAMVLFCVILTVFIAVGRLSNPQNERPYQSVEEIIVEDGANPADIMIAANPAAYYLQTGRSAVALPYGGDRALFAVSKQFNAKYLTLEENAVIDSLKYLYEDPRDREGFDYLGEADGTYIYKIIQ